MPVGIVQHLPGRRLFFFLLPLLLDRLLLRPLELVDLGLERS